MEFYTPEQWAAEDYKRNLAHPEGLKHRSAKGIMMRSRAEVSIAGVIDSLDRVYRYEQIIYIDGEPYAPDFTVFVPGTQELKYIEYCGMMDDPEYVQRFRKKDRAYFEAGIRSGQNLLNIFENSDHELDLEYIARQIGWFLEIR